MQELLRNRYFKWGGIILLLILANIISYIYSNWGLITVNVTDVPLNKVIKSIEWQGWVRIYTNIAPDAKVTMYVDHVPLAEAMETLATSVTLPPNPDRLDRPDRGNRPDQAAGGPPPGGGAPGGFAGGGDRPGGGGPPGGGGGGFRGGGVQWNLAFFVAPTAAEVQQEILAFESGSTDDDTRVYNYATPLQMVASDSDMPVADPRLQSWPGMKPPPAPTPAPEPAATDSTSSLPPPDGQAPADTTPTLQTYLQAFAQSSNIWIMSPGSWTSPVSGEPPANSSIIRAIKNFISSSHGSVTQALVLRAGRGGGRGPGGGNRGGGFANMDDMADRMRNAINGLPEDARADALSQLDAEVNFYHSVKAAPQEQQRDMIRQHMMDKMANGNNNWRRSPEQRAQRYARVVANRMAAQGKK